MNTLIILWFIIGVGCWGASWLWRRNDSHEHLVKDCLKLLTRSQKAFVVLVVLYAMLLGYETTSSDSFLGVVLTILWFPIAVFLGLRSLVQFITQKHHLLVKLYLLGGLAVTLILAYYSVWLLQNPLYFQGVRYEFSYGQSPTWQAVQFSYIQNGVTVKGPWIGSYPVRVSFPDIDHDGYRDIRITGNGRLTEYRFLPDGRGKNQYWTLIQNSGYKISYKVDGYYYP
jgi:hypothetical protein